jgi:hypothetical protein
MGSSLQTSDWPLYVGPALALLACEEPNFLIYPIFLGFFLNDKERCCWASWVLIGPVNIELSYDALFP